MNDLDFFHRYLTAFTKTLKESEHKSEYDRGSAFIASLILKAFQERFLIIDPRISESVEAAKAAAND